MKKSTIIKLAVIILALVVVVISATTVRTDVMTECGLCSEAGEILAECEECGGTGEVVPASNYYATFVSLLPPILAIILALVTKEVYSSLFAGIVIAALFACNFNPVGAMDALLGEGLIGAVEGTAGIFIFLVVLGILVALINKAGGSAAFGAWAEKNIKTRTGAMLATFVLGVLIFIDDYFNCLTVGSVMTPVADRHKISRAKLAYLIDATAAPICMIAPISSWAAAVASYAPEGTSGISMFIQAIPYNFYSLLTFVFVIVLCIKKCDFGPMRIHELNAIKKGDLFTSGERVEGGEEEIVSTKAKVIDLIFPVIVLIALCVVSLIYVGGFFGVDIWGGTENAGNFIGSFANTDATFGLPWGAIIVLVITIAYFMLRKLITFKEAMECVPKGFIAMVPPILILTFATALKNVNSLMGYATYVENLLVNASALANLLPAVIFVVACILSFATGTSWGTFGILIPIVTVIFEAGDPLQIIGMSACLAGAVCGDHCSPISDTTIMSSAGAKCDHINHVSTQLPYAITVAVISFVSYIIAGYVQNWYIVFPIAVILTIATMLIISKVTAKKEVQA